MAPRWMRPARPDPRNPRNTNGKRSEEHTSELQSLRHLVCRLLLEKKKNKRVQADNLRGGRALRGMSGQRQGWLLSPTADCLRIHLSRYHLDIAHLRIVHLRRCHA